MYKTKQWVAIHLTSFPYFCCPLLKTLWFSLHCAKPSVHFCSFLSLYKQLYWHWALKWWWYCFLHSIHEEIHAVRKLLLKSYQFFKTCLCTKIYIFPPRKSNCSVSFFIIVLCFLLDYQKQNFLDQFFFCMHLVCHLKNIFAT